MSAKGRDGVCSGHPSLQADSSMEDAVSKAKQLMLEPLKAEQV